MTGNRIWASLCLSLCLLLLSASMSAADTDSLPNLYRDYDVTVRINGQTIPYGDAFVRADGTPYVSVRSAAEAFGMTGTWNDKKKRVDVSTTNGQTFAFPMTRSYFWFNGQRYSLRFETETEADSDRRGVRVLIPATEIGRLFAAEAKWDAQSKQGEITKPDGAVAADRDSGFQREWDVWSPEPGLPLELARSFFPAVHVAGSKLTVQVPKVKGGRSQFVYYVGTEQQTPLQPGKTYTFPIGKKYAGVFAMRTDSSGAVEEEYWMWLNPGSPNFQSGMYGGQGLPVIIQDMRNKVVSLDRMQQVVGSLEKTIDCGTAVFRGKEGSLVRLPLVCAGVPSAVNGPNSRSTSRSASNLPTVNFDIPQEQRDRLAAYWMNRDSKVGENGILLIGPRDWRVFSAGIDALGSSAIELQDPNVPWRHLSLRTIPACQSCAISAIGTYFPDLRKWAKAQKYPGSEIDFAERKTIDPNTVAFTRKSEDPNQTVRGVAYQRHNKKSVFGSVELSTDLSSQELSDTIIDFAAMQLSRWLP